MRVLFMSGGDSVQFRRDLERTERLYLEKPFDSRKLIERGKKNRPRPGPYPPRDRLNSGRTGSERRH